MYLAVTLRRREQIQTAALIPHGFWYLYRSLCDENHAVTIVPTSRCKPRISSVVSFVEPCTAFVNKSIDATMLFQIPAVILDIVGDYIGSPIRVQQRIENRYRLSLFVQRPTQNLAKARFTGFRHAHYEGVHGGSSATLGLGGRQTPSFDPSTRARYWVSESASLGTAYTPKARHKPITGGRSATPYFSHTLAAWASMFCDSCGWGFQAGPNSDSKPPKTTAHKNCAVPL